MFLLQQALFEEREVAGTLPRQGPGHLDVLRLGLLSKATRGPGPGLRAQGPGPGPARAWAPGPGRRAPGPGTWGPGAGAGDRGPGPGLRACFAGAKKSLYTRQGLIGSHGG